jgi:hypothetical protein
VFVDGRFSFCTFSFGYCVVSVHRYTDSDYSNYTPVYIFMNI